MAGKHDGKSTVGNVFPNSNIDPRPGIGLGGTTTDEASSANNPEQGRQNTSRTRRGFWGGLKFLFGGPISSIGVENIAENASYIRTLARNVRGGAQSDSNVHVCEDRSIDIEATAINEGKSVLAIRAMMVNRRLQTKWSVFCYLTGAPGFFGAWVWEASHSYAYTRLPYVIILCLVCGLFCLRAFHNALVNWQIRTLRLGSWREFLNTSESWWPS